MLFAAFYLPVSRIETTAQTLIESVSTQLNPEPDNRVPNDQGKKQSRLQLISNFIKFRKPI